MGKIKRCFISMTLIWIIEFSQGSFTMISSSVRNFGRIGIVIVIDLVWEDYQYFNGDISHDLNVIVLVGKVIDRPLFGNEIEKKEKENRWLSSIFTLKLKYRYIQELPPQIVKDLNEPVY